MNDRIPDWLLERHALGELPPDLDAQIRRRIAERPAEEERLRALRAHDRTFLATHPPDAVVPAIMERREGRAEPSCPRALALAPLAAAASVALALVLFVGESGEEVRDKGAGPALLVHRSRGGVVERLENGALAQPGDLVQLSYRAAGRRHGLVVSVDGGGVVSLHLPTSGAWSAALEPKGTVALPHAYELDDAPEYERFFFVLSDAPFRVDEVLEVARGAPRGADRLPLDSRFEQVSFLLRKPRSGAHR